ncbi:unnamed protein product [Lactuca saligna]|uniref:DUF7794 domain-containing protein n=1 Tax=Lactuca saligna TaxID=75948 RepID=A0AA35VM92_LACSI|nr:unnamed protein product [Lactuca saligna]
MDSIRVPSLTLILLIISSILCLQSKADGTGSVYLLDSSTHHYFQSHSSESKSLSLPEVGAAISVLLGFAPPSTLSSASSEKLNEVLTPNPFVRPHAVFLLEVNGLGDKQLELNSDGDVFSRGFKSEVAIENTEIQLSEDELSLVSLNEPLESTEKDLINFALRLGGEYINNAAEPLTGELTIPLSNNVQITLHMSKKADREFIVSLVSLFHNAQKAVELHADLEGSKLTPSELIKGKFDGFKAFQEHYGTDDIVHKGAELLVTSISMIYNSFQTTYKGQIVGVVVFNGSPTKESDSMLTIKLTTQQHPRWLEEKSLPDFAKIAEVALVRKTLAWITGIILIVSTLMGICFLFNMPITRDTLLYSNVKLD